MVVEEAFFLVELFVIALLLMLREVRFGGGRGGLRGLIGLGRGLDGRVGGGSGRLLLRLGRTLLIDRLSFGRDYIICPVMVKWLRVFGVFWCIRYSPLHRN